MTEDAGQRPSIWEPLHAQASTGAAPRPADSAPDPAAGPATAPSTGHPGADGRPVYLLAGWGRRAAAFLVDAFVLWTLALLVLVLVGLMEGMTVPETVFFSVARLPPGSVADPVALYLAYLAVRLLIALVRATFLATWDGRTPGKALLGLQVMRADGTPMTWGTALRREVVGRTLLVGGLSVPSCGLAAIANYLAPLVDGGRRTGHDALAHTRVIVDPAATGDTSAPPGADGRTPAP